MKNFNKTERYVAFLLTYLPKLQPLTLATPFEKCPKRGAVLNHTLNYLKDKKGLNLEFGVYQGSSINMSAKKYLDKHFYGFDSFEGFPSDNRKDWDQDFSVETLPEVPANVSLIKGWFSETLPEFLDKHKSNISFINVDCDIYSSTKDVFDELVKRQLLKPGVIIFFDELINYNGYLWNEALALFEMLERTGLGIEWICAHQNVRLLDETASLYEIEKHPNWAQDLETGYRQQASLILTDKGIDYSIFEIEHVRRKIQKIVEVIQQEAIKRKIEHLAV